MYIKSQKKYCLAIEDLKRKKSFIKLIMPLAGLANEGLRKRSM